MAKPASNLLFTGSEWNFSTLSRAYDAIEEIAIGEMGLDVYPNQIEIISSEQMLDAYRAVRDGLKNRITKLLAG